MCGIVGFINSSSELDLDLIWHRGPDSQETYVNGKVQLGHARLSIQDISSSSNQPFKSDDEKCILVFNGEIYNHLELREELKLLGRTFRTTGDTETVLVALMEWGKDALIKLNGIFAFCYFDTNSGSFLMARDRFGVKPFYYGFESGSFAFASELKALLPWEHFSLEPDVIALERYVRFLWSPGERTSLLGIKKLIPGEYIEFCFDGKNILHFTREKFYREPFRRILNISENEMIESLDFNLRRAVKRQLLSDVPVGFFLSGGLDSSLLVAIAKDLHPEKSIQCFTIDTQEFAVSEGISNDLYYARKVASHLNVNLEVVPADKNILDDFDKMIWHLDEPQADAAPLNVLKISAKAREMGFKVLIGGTGGDDLFSGYRRHSALKILKALDFVPAKVFQLLKRILHQAALSNSRVRRLLKFLNSFSEKGVDRVFSLFEWITWRESSRLFVLPPPEKERFSFFKNLYNDANLSKFSLEDMLTIERKSFLVDHNLSYTDKMGMAVGVEIRVPYLDNDLVEFARQIPDYYKIHEGQLKYILKKVAERYLPNEVIYRKKAGFGAPVRKWIDEDLKSRIQKDLSQESIEKYGVLKFDEVQRLLDRNKNNGVDYSYSIWSLLAIQSWLNQFSKE